MFSPVLKHCSIIYEHEVRMTTVAAADDMTKEQLLVLKNPLRILDLDDLTGSFRKFAMRWHPDRGGDPAIFAKVSEWRDQLQEVIEGKRHEVDGIRFFRSKDGKESRLIFLAKRKTDTGQMYLGRGFVTFVEDAAASAHFNASFPKFSFRDDKMRQGMEQFLPLSMEDIAEADDVAYVIKKDPGLMPMQILIDHLGGCGKILPVHAAWMTSRMMHIACYLAHYGIVHMGFNTTNLFVNPKTHGAALLGGWRLSRKVNESFSAVPAFTLKFTPRSVVEQRKARHSMDLVVIKAVARMLFGDINGRHLHEKTPKEVRHWLNLPASATALEQYKTWEEALKGFGPRKFVEMDVDPDSIYAKLA